MRKLFTAAALIAAVVATPALANPSAPAPAPKPTATSSAPAEMNATPDTVYCSLSYFTGSRIGKKVCKTRAAWISDHDFDPLTEIK